MTRVKKLIDFPGDMAINIQTLATLEERTFVGQVRQLINESLITREVKN